MRTWIVIVAVGAGSYLLRALPVLANPGWARSPRFERAIAHAATGALAALCAVGLRRHATSAVDVVALGAAAAVGLLLAMRGRAMPVVLAASGAIYALVQIAAALS